MKKLIFIITLAVLCSFNAMAQQRVNDIRKAYSEALALVKEHNTESCTTGVNHLQLFTEENVPGSGPCTRTVDIYYKGSGYTDNDYQQTYTIYFIRVKHLWAGNRPEMYEYLFDPQTLKLMFVYSNITTYEGTKEEQRLYYDTKEELFKYIGADKQSVNVTKDEGLYMLGADQCVEAHAYVEMFRSVLTHTFTGEAPRIQGYK